VSSRLRDGIRHESCSITMKRGDDTLVEVFPVGIGGSRQGTIACHAGACRGDDEQNQTATDVADPALVETVARRGGGDRAEVTCAQWISEHENVLVLGCDVSRSGP
jgi:hypothetical protein